MHGSTDPTATSRSLDVLVVDDNVDFAVLLVDLLEVAGHRARVAHDGRQALEMVRRARPDLALIDIGLPEIDGRELARRVRGEHADIHLIAVSGYGQKQDIEANREAGFEHHLTKPVAWDALEAVLRDLAAS